MVQLKNHANIIQHQMSSTDKNNPLQQNTTFYLQWLLKLHFMQVFHADHVFIINGSTEYKLLSGFQCSFLGVKWAGCKLTSHLILVQRLRMSGAIPLLPLYAFMLWRGKIHLYTTKNCTHTQCKQKMCTHFAPRILRIKLQQVQWSVIRLNLHAMR
jgi:hypothetical protein